MASLNATFQALSDPTRRQILSRLSRRELSIAELAKPYKMSLPGVIKHLDVLARAGLVRRRRRGRIRVCSFVGAPLKRATDWLVEYRHFWDGQLDSLEKYFSTAKGSD